MTMIKKVVIAGGGTAGWMSAAAISKLLGEQVEITLVESDAIGTVGVGEATIPPLIRFHDILGIKESEFMAATNATFKLGISFENWKNVGENYIHSFGTLGRDHWSATFHHFFMRGKKLGLTHDMGDYCLEHLAAREERFQVQTKGHKSHAYHLDATAYAKYLRTFSEKHGVKRIEGKIERVEKHLDGDIKSLKLDNGLSIEGDLFIDCTGFRALLIEQTLHAGYDDWSHWLPCDRALAVQTKSVGVPIPYTRSIAHDSGWQWRIPLQTRVGNGLVYSSRHMSDDEAFHTLTSNVEGERLFDPRPIQFRTGTRRKHWHRNCVAVGLSSGFLEPLESTSIHLIQRNILRLLKLFPESRHDSHLRDEFNAQASADMKNILDFIVLHYFVTDRRDTEFWRFCSSMAIPNSLKHRLDMFKKNGRIFKHGEELFAETSWVQVMMGQGLIPDNYHISADTMSERELANFLNSIRDHNIKTVAAMPKHYEYLNHYCPSERSLKDKTMS